MAKIVFSSATMMSLATTESKIELLSSSYNFRTTVAVLRLDELHPVVSGNKWYKLRRYLQTAVAQSRSTVLTFGGAYSNHILATAAACHHTGLQSVGLIRGEEPRQLSPTLQQAAAFGMTLHFISRSAYQSKLVPPALQETLQRDNVLVIPEGGYGAEGAQGASGILVHHSTKQFTHLLTAVGTGTTLAGLVLGAEPHQTVLGIPVLKNAASLRSEVEALLPKHLHHRFQLLNDYHFGGYAKYTPELIFFMNEFYRRNAIPTDFVYTAKAFYAGLQLADTNYFGVSDNLLMVHTGGLQGNRSLAAGTLIFGV